MQAIIIIIETELTQISGEKSSWIYRVFCLLEAH
jgi:hypothetical protein